MSIESWAIVLVSYASGRLQHGRCKWTGLVVDNTLGLRSTVHGILRGSIASRYMSVAVECSFSVLASSMSLLGVVVGGAIGFFSARTISNRNAKAGAAARLRAAFAQGLAQIELDRLHGSTHDQPDVKAFFKAALLAHAAAIEEFRPFVSGAKRQSYQQAWDRYVRSVQEQKVDAWDPATTKQSEHPWHVVVENINAVLSHAET
jgi:hypothetical protein